MSAPFLKCKFVRRALSVTVALIGTVSVVATVDSCNSAQEHAATQPAVPSPKEDARPAWLYSNAATREVLDDLRGGEGKPPPATTPWEDFDMSGHGWIEEGTDLARVAMQELTRRDKLGLLSPADQREIDRLALADLASPIKAPGQFYIHEYLGDRWLNGKLSSDELTELYKAAIRPSLKTDRVVTQWNEVPLRFECDCFLPGRRYGQWELLAHYKGIRIDGNPVERSDTYFRDYSDPDWAFQMQGGSRGEVARTAICYSTLGSHRLEVTLQIDIRRGPSHWPEQRPIIFSEIVTLNAEFEEKPPSTLLKCYRLIQDPQHEALHYVTAAQLQMFIDHPLACLSAPAMNEFMRRRRLAETTPEEGQKLIADLLAVQKDRSHHWFPAYGDYLEWLHDQNALSDSQWKQYGAQQLGFYIRG